MKPLNTPLYIKNMGYIRCNCKVGVPNESVRFEQIPRAIYVGNIQIQSYNELMDHNSKFLYLKALEEKYTGTLIMFYIRKLLYVLINLLLC